MGEYSEAGVAGRPSGWRVVGRSGGRSNCDSGALRSVRPAIRRLSLRRLPASSVSAVRLRLPRRVGVVDAGRDHRNADDAVQAFVEGGADDDVGVLVGLFADARAASSTSNSVRSLPPVIEISRPLARLIEGSSINGLEIAASAALRRVSRRKPRPCPSSPCPSRA